MPERGRRWRLRRPGCASRAAGAPPRRRRPETPIHRLSGRNRHGAAAASISVRASASLTMSTARRRSAADAGPDGANRVAGTLQRRGVERAGDRGDDARHRRADDRTRDAEPRAQGGSGHRGQRATHDLGERQVETTLARLGLRLGRGSGLFVSVCDRHDVWAQRPTGPDRYRLRAKVMNPTRASRPRARFAPPGSVFLSHSQTKSVSAPSLVQTEPGAPLTTLAGGASSGLAHASRLPARSSSHSQTKSVSAPSLVQTEPSAPRTTLAAVRLRAVHVSRLLARSSSRTRRRRACLLFARPDRARRSANDARRDACLLPRTRCGCSPQRAALL